MAWKHLSITSPHLVYIILGGFTSLFMLCSSIIKERMYIGEATVATLCGLIFGPHAANLIDPQSWGSVDTVTIEFSRIVLVVQCFAVGVELPKFYMERHWKSVVFLLLPVMTFGWLITSLFVYWMVPPLNWLESLVIAACVTATDPVLASSVVGKGKFAKRVPKHLRDLLSAESGCNDGMAFPFIYLSLYLIQDEQNAREVSFHWIVYTILYECIFGAVYGFLIGYIARHGIKYAERNDLIDRESFLVFYFVLALFCAGSGSILGVDDLLVGFSAGVGFSNDGWFGHKTEESHVSNVIDLLLNLAYFVYLGTIIPWEMFNNTEIGLSAWRLTIIAVFVILFRRIPIMMALKPLIPDIKTWREALFAGHFGPIGVGAIFVAILARAELESESPVPLAELPSPDVEHYTLLTLVWPIVTFMVIASIIVHGSSIAVFTLGKRINTLTVTMSYTTAPEDGPSWMNRLPRISSQSRSQARTTSDTDLDDLKPEIPSGALLPVAIPGQFLRRMREDDGPNKQGSRASSIVSRRRRKKWDDGIGPGGPISQSAIYPQRRNQAHQATASSPVELDLERVLRATDRDDISLSYARPPPFAGQDARQQDNGAHSVNGKHNFNHLSENAESSAAIAMRPQIERYDEGNNDDVENGLGDILSVQPIASSSSPSQDGYPNTNFSNTREDIRPDNMMRFDMLVSDTNGSSWTLGAIKRKLGKWKNVEVEKRKDKHKESLKHEPARAYQFGTTIILEDEDGEVVKKYELPSQRSDNDSNDVVSQSLKYMGILKTGDRPTGHDEDDTAKGKAAKQFNKSIGVSNWMGFGRTVTGEVSSQKQRKKSVVEEQEEDDDRHIRFTIGGVGKRMTKDGFIKEMQKLDRNTRQEIVDRSSASHLVKTQAKQELSPSPTGAHSPESIGDQLMNDHKGVGFSRDDGSSHCSSGSQPTSSVVPYHRSVIGINNAKVAGTANKESPETIEKHRDADLRGVDNVAKDDDDAKETPAERRRREAALGMSCQIGDDSDDDDTPRVPPARRGIRFADTPERRYE